MTTGCCKLLICRLRRVTIGADRDPTPHPKKLANLYRWKMLRGHDLVPIRNVCELIISRILAAAR